MSKQAALENDRSLVERIAIPSRNGMNSVLRERASRREMLTLSAAGVAGASLSGWFGSLASGASDQPRRSKSCILLWMDGGPSHVESFDPKPEAAADVRGELGTIQTSVPGILVGEKFPRVAELMQHGAILRG